MATELTREELFKQVWERPMTKVAAEYGISDVALKKICDKHLIPVPGRGYWAKKAAGKKVEKAHFRAVADQGIDRITIYGSSLQNLPEPVKEARAQAKKRETSLDNKVEVGPAPSEYHPTVERARKKLKHAKPLETGLLNVSGEGLFNVEVSPGSVERAAIFLNTLMIAAESRGCQVVKGGPSLVFFVDGEVVSFKLVEAVKRTKHIPTLAETSALEAWQRRRSRNWDAVSWESRPKIPEWDYSPEGKLAVLIDERKWSHDGVRRKFADGKTQTIERMLNSVLEGLVVCAATIKAVREDTERCKREWEEAERKRLEQHRRDALERKWVEALSKDLERWMERKRVLEYVAMVEGKLEAVEYEDPEVVREWIKWATDYANRLDPLAKGLPKLLQYEDFNSWELR